MSPREELEMIVSLIKKYNLPMSPILEYAINEKLESFGSVSPLAEVQPERKTNISADYNSYDSIKDQFREYLFATKSQGTARNYLKLLDGHVRRYISQIVDPNADSILSYTTTDSIKACILKLKADDSFLSDNARWHNALTASLRSYLCFIDNIS